MTANRSRSQRALVPHSREVFSPQKNENGITLIELLIVVSIIAIIGTLLLPALQRAKEKAQSIHCLHNMKQLSFSWTLYSQDHEDRLLPNSPWREASRWLHGSFRLGQRNHADHTNVALLHQSLMAPYQRDLRAYKCPSDPTRALYSRGGRIKQHPWVRSVGLNQWMAGVNSKRYRTYRRLTEIDSPANRFTFLNQRADTYENAYFVTGSENLFKPPHFRWREFPARYHNNATALSFADGHSEIHSWSTQWPWMKTSYAGEADSFAPHSVDIQWINDRATALK